MSCSGGECLGVVVDSGLTFSLCEHVMLLTQFSVLLRGRGLSEQARLQLVQSLVLCPYFIIVTLRLVIVFEKRVHNKFDLWSKRICGNTQIMHYYLFIYVFMFRWGYIWCVPGDRGVLRGGL